MMAEWKRLGGPSGSAVKFAFTTDPPDEDGDRGHPRRMGRSFRGNATDESHGEQRPNKMAGTVAQCVAEKGRRLDEGKGEKSRGREGLEEDDDRGLMMQLIAAGGSERWGHYRVYSLCCPCLFPSPLLP